MFDKLRLFIARLYLKLIKKEVYYVNGPDILPPPLTNEEEAEQIKLLGIDPEATAKLIEHNLRLVVYIAKKFENTGVSIDDLT